MDYKIIPKTMEQISETMTNISENENTIKRLKTFGYVMLVVVMMFIALVSITLIYSKGTSFETSAASIASIL